jgi:hypothetical protein
MSAGGTGAVSKICVVCGCDCSTRPRVKDPRGRYYCKPCYDLKSARLVSGDAAAGGSPPPPPVGDDPAAAGQSLGCSNCGALLPADAVRCITCGHDRRGGAPVAAAARRPRPSVGWIDWLVRPGQWMSGLLREPERLGRLTTLSFFVAIAMTIAEVPTRAVDRAPGLGPGVGWGLVLGVGALIGVVMGVLYAIVAPWWLGVRIGWSGGLRPDSGTARVAYFASALPALAVIVIGAVVLVTTYSSPFVAFQTDVLLDLSLFAAYLVALSAGSVHLFLQCKGAFQVRPLRGILLIVVLPIVWYWGLLAAGLALGAVLAASNPEALAKATGVAPETRLPIQHAAAPTTPYSFRAPRNWTIETDEVDPEAPDGPRGVMVAGLDGSAVYLLLMPNDAAYGDAEVLDWAIGATRELIPGAALRHIEDIATLGSFPGIGSGAGRVFLLTDGEGTTRYTSFVTRVAGGRAMLIETYVPEPDGAGGRKGVDFVLNSLQIRP